MTVLEHESIKGAERMEYKGDVYERNGITRLIQRSPLSNEQGLLTLLEGNQLVIFSFSRNCLTWD